MRFLVLLAIILLATKKVGEFVLSIFCLLAFGYGCYVLLRDTPRPRFPQRMMMSPVS
jgi:hypothetical protein